MALAIAPTWGISSGVFLLGYAILAVAVVFGVLRARKALTDTGGKVLPTDRERHPHDLALLHTGPTLAVYSALSAMHLRGTISSARGAAWATGRAADCPNELERAIHASTGSGARVAQLANRHEVDLALKAARERLVTAGLLLSDLQRARIKLLGLWVGAVAVLGVLRIVAGVGNGAPVGFVTAMTIVVTGIAVVLLSTAPRRTKAGDRELARLRAEQHALAPSNSPDWTVYGPEGAALAIGVYGTSALWASDPAFAADLALQRQATGGGDGGGGGDSGGGDGGGGGGGCGGGCGGCGGG